MAAVSPRLPRGLVRSNDAKPGIARERRGKGFSYRRADGRPITDAAELQRIRSLAIPPAYREVWICPRPNGHLQATGLDARGRKQYRYHAAWREERDLEKFDSLPTFAQRLPRIRRAVARALDERDHARPLLLAAVVRLLDTTFGRIGNDQYARDNGSYGLTTLRDRHVRLAGGCVALQFRGKSGIRHSLPVADARVAEVVQGCLALPRTPGCALFRYLDEAGAPHCIGSADVNDYLKRVAGADAVSAKDFRTWHASVLGLDITARALAQDAARAAGRSETRGLLKRMLAEVAGALGNTPAVCRKSYVHPRVVALAALAGRDADAARAVLQHCAPATRRAGLRQAERRLLAFLDCDKAAGLLAGGASPR